jgi:hypothetical protein
LLLNSPDIQKHFQLVTFPGTLYDESFGEDMPSLRFRVLCPFVLVFATSIASAQTMSHANAINAPSDKLELHVAAQNITLSADELKSKPHVTVTIHNPHTQADEIYSGVPLIDLLASLGAPHGKDLHGKALSEYIVATGSDGYKAVLALAEADPEFHPGQILIADQMDNKPLDAKTGPFRLVVTEDKRPARSVHNLVSIELKTAE